MGKKTPKSGGGAKRPAPLPIEITSVAIGRKSISIAYDQGESIFAMCERDNPLPSFTRALEALTPLVGVICHFPKSYSEEGLRVVGFRIGVKGGTQTVSILARKHLDDAAKEFAIVSPERLLDNPTQEGRYTPPLSKKDAELVLDAINEAKEYVRGERAQGQIAFEEEDGEGHSDDSDPGQGELPGTGD